MAPSARSAWRLRDVPERPMFVETVPTRGYRFIAPIEPLAETPESQTSRVHAATTAALVPNPDSLPPPPRAPESSPAAVAAESVRPVRRVAWSRVWAASVAALMLGAFLAWRWYASDAAASRLILAVLPFENLSGDPDRDYLADGLWEEMVVALDKLDPQRVGVLGRSSIRDYQRGVKSPAAIGRELGADYLVDSSIRAEKGRLRIVAKLTRVHDQEQIWSDAYDREPASVLDMQRELSAAIAAQIGLRLAPDRVAALGRRQTPNPDAYDLYLRGRYFENRRTPPTTAMAIEYFRQATALDPDYALAWSSMSLTYAARPINSDVPPAEVTRLAREAARQAVRADAGLAEAQLAQAYVAWSLDWDWTAAEAALRRAVSLDANLAMAHQVLGHVLSQMGKHDEAKVSLRRARELQALDPLPLAISSQVALQARDYTAALDYAVQATALDSQLWIGHMMQGQALERMGRHALALDALTAAMGLSGNNSKTASLRGYVLARTGREDDAACCRHSRPRRSSATCRRTRSPSSTPAWRSRTRCSPGWNAPTPRATFTSCSSPSIPSGTRIAPIHGSSRSWSAAASHAGPGPCRQTASRRRAVGYSARSAAHGSIRVARAARGPLRRGSPNPSQRRTGVRTCGSKCSTTHAS
jgi:TolB-like protein/Flp pilus assembly protein TadD